MARTSEGKPPGWRPGDDRYENDGKEDNSCSLLDEGNLPFHYDIQYHEITHPMVYDPHKSKRRNQMVSVPSCWTRLLCLKPYPKTLKEFGVCFPFSPAVFAQMENSLKKDIIHICPFLHVLRSQTMDYSDWAHIVAVWLLSACVGVSEVRPAKMASVGPSNPSSLQTWPRR